ncbi:MAG: 50S ribosomal protein L18, partial [Nitrososphaerales archaeon]
MSRIPFVTVGVSNKNIIVQFLRAKISGDVVVSSTHSRELIQKYGWKGSGNNLPAAYLVGFLSGLKAIKGDLKKAIPYLGTQRFIKRSRLAAVLKGVEDSGLSINFPEEAGPELDRIQGVHIANYAKELKRKDTDYKRRFSALLKQGLKPEDYPKHF